MKNNPKQPGEISSSEKKNPRKEMNEGRTGGEEGRGHYGECSGRVSEVIRQKWTLRASINDNLGRAAGYIPLLLCYFAQSDEQMSRVEEEDAFDVSAAP